LGATRKDKRVVAIIHRATIGFRVDTKYAERKVEAKKRGYKWGGYHYGKPANPIKAGGLLSGNRKA
jgi:GH25 family lysozyme M1 (1,4-beta-N-acetylmuramidase)